MRWLLRKTTSGLLVVLLTLSGPAQALDFWPFDDEGIAFDLEVQGIEDAERRDELEELAREAIDPDNPPETVARVQALKGLMAERVRQSMRSQGWYDARVRAYLKDEENDLPLVRIRVDEGPRYVIGSSRIEWREGEPLDGKYDDLFMAAGTPAQAETINASAEKLRNRIAVDRCLLSLSVNPVAVLDSTSQEVEVVYRIDHGPLADFGPTQITGETDVSETIIRKYVKWQQGDCYKESKVDATQIALLKSQLFASAQIEVADTPNEAGQVPVTITMTDRAHRTLSAGVQYESDQGAGVKAGWEHRNLWSKAHKFKTQASVSQREYAVDSNYTIPFFYHNKQKLNVGGGIKQEDTDAYESQNIAVLAALDRQLTPELLVGAGGGARFSHITETGEETENFGLVYFPFFAEWDTRDDVLDPTKGWFIRGSIAPYQDVTGQGVNFLKSQVNAQTYFTAEKIKWKPTLAFRGTTGLINGASTDDVPADLRFYAGGGGSVRGYGYQSLGPREDGAPKGGTRWNELSAELRLRFTETIGGVVFVDAGNVYDQELPNPVDKMFISTGVGARYYSPIGPLRFDVGIPLDDIEGEDGYGVYISIGQAF